MEPGSERSFYVQQPHAMAPDDVFARLDSSVDGLSAEEAAERLRTVGPNRLRSAAQEGLLRQMLSLHAHARRDGQWAEKRADVGVAMGVKGTEATKEAADIALADDNFTSMERALEEGRTIYDNLRKAIAFILPTNGAEALVVLTAIVLGQVLPLTPVQILRVNMVTAVTLGLALAFEPAEAGLMRQPPRKPGTPILDSVLLWRIGFVSTLIGGATMAVFLLVELEKTLVRQWWTSAVQDKGASA